jgi:hypothetical protein
MKLLSLKAGVYLQNFTAHNIPQLTDHQEPPDDQ